MLFNKMEIMDLGGVSKFFLERTRWYVLQALLATRSAAAAQFCPGSWRAALDDACTNECGRAAIQPCVGTTVSGSHHFHVPQNIVLLWTSFSLTHTHVERVLSSQATHCQRAG